MPEVWEGKSYENYESHNFNEYMIELGVGFFTRQIGNALTPTVSLEKNGNIYKLTTSSTFKTQVLEFELGKEFDETTLDDRQVKSICTMEGNTLIQQQGGAKPGTITREFSATEMIATMKVGNVTCIRKYKAV
ncbi:Fatty acid-binding protein, heart [Pseudolycoriella hygida]|uniref:Fatty acid-binding protein, muscle n=1 Tax=Pseudolycoriella hygida TaxID=35572 RepID=A0A9Q0MP85_9DIPT|nr:Fatty acid-binding protein, heart [Pseudolycoriella hygida]